VPRSETCDAIPPLSQYAFMAWCSVKAQRHLNLYLYPIRMPQADTLGHYFLPSFLPSQVFTQGYVISQTMLCN